LKVTDCARAGRAPHASKSKSAAVNPSLPLRRRLPHDPALLVLLFRILRTVMISPLLAFQ
jgi:hypothetical protein